MALLTATVAFPMDAAAQEVALKTNLVADATLSPSLGLEFVTAPRWSFDLSGSYNDWPVDGHKWKHWVLKPEWRYWFCEAMSGHFVGFHLLGGQYNVGNIDMDFKLWGTDFSKLRHRRYEGWFAGLGLAYGYAWMLSKHWSFEAVVGLGWTYTRYDSYPCAKCGTKIDDDKSHHYLGPTKAALNLIYVLP